MTAIMLVPLLIVGGAGVDFMRHEVLRSKLQDSLDRGVLAAASLNQTKNPDVTIRSYLKSARLPDDIVLEIDETKTANYRHINANAPLAVDPGLRDELVFVRACIFTDPLTPGLGIGFQLEKDNLGGYKIITQSAFLNEPEGD